AELAREEEGEIEAALLVDMLAVFVEPGVVEGHALDLTGRIAADVGAAKDGAVERGNVEGFGLKIGRFILGDERQVGLEDVKPEAAGGFEVAADALQGAVLFFECGEDQESVEEEDDPVEFLFEVEIEDVLLNQSLLGVLQ